MESSSDLLYFRQSPSFAPPVGDKRSAMVHPASATPGITMTCVAALLAHDTPSRLGFHPLGRGGYTTF
eukprot:14442197-Ditylum_brightwellii.AAC.2